MSECQSLLSEADEGASPMMMASAVQAIVTRHTGNEDPYLDIKYDCNRVGRNCVDRLRVLLSESEEPMTSVLKIAAIGNIMDYGAMEDFDVKALMAQLNERDFRVDHRSRFEAALEGASSITYFCDNTGEIYFDSILLEYLADLEQVKRIRLVIRSRPFLNDVSSEVFLPPVLKNHSKIEVVSLPVVRTHQDPQVWRYLMSSDMVLCKGMANFENYSDEDGFFFLLISKCLRVSSVLQDKTGVPVQVGDWILMQA